MLFKGLETYEKTTRSSTIITERIQGWLNVRGFFKKQMNN